jgi:hypothetical protein
MSIGLHVKVPVIFVPFQRNLNFLDSFSKKYSNIKFHENPSKGAELFHADRRTHMTKLIVAFRKFTNASKNEIFVGLETKTFALKSKRCKQLTLTGI